MKQFPLSLPRLDGVDGLDDLLLREALDDAVGEVGVLAVDGKHLEDAGLEAAQGHGLDDRAVLLGVEGDARVESPAEAGAGLDGGEIRVGAENCIQC